jgi:KTSC domain
LGTTRSTFCFVYSGRNSGGFVKGATVLRIVLIFCISIAVLAVGSAKPSPTPSQIISHIPRQHVASTAIAAVGYSKRRHILEIEFVNGAIYRYVDVAPSLYRELMLADSKARFYDANIRRHYQSVLIRPRHKNDLHN